MIYENSRDGDTSSECQDCIRQGAQSHNYQQLEREFAQGEQPLSFYPRTAPMKPKTRNDSVDFLRLLQEEVKQLKFRNQEQQREIKQLRYELQVGRSKNYLSPQLMKSTKQIPRFSKQSPSSNRMIGRVFSPQPKGYQSRQRAPMLQTALLQKQIKQYQLKMLQLNSQLKEYEQNFAWMQKFIDSFVHMAEELSVNYGGPIELRGLTLRKKAKVSWRYMKDLINYLIK